jgi:hypothetical protein
VGTHCEAHGGEAVVTPKLELLDHQTIVVSPSQLEVIRSCPRMWYFKHLCRRVEVVPEAATMGGHAFDSALNLRYQKLGGAPCDLATEAEMHALIDAAYRDVELPLDEFRTPARYKEVISAYNAHWQQEPFEVLGVQVPFAVELGSVEVPDSFWVAYWHAQQLQANGQLKTTDIHCAPRVRVILRGILDLFIRVGEHVFIMDTKTSKNDIGSGYSNSAQMKAYMWALQELARVNPDAGLPPRVHGTMINGVVIRPPYKNSVRKPTDKDRPRNDFTRTFPEFFSQERLEEWRRDTLLWVEQALGWVARDHFPQKERHCTFHVDASFTNYGYYGKCCPYLQVCPLPKEQRLTTLESDLYMDYARGPLAEVKEEKVEVTI